MSNVRFELLVTQSGLADVHGDRSRRLRVQAVRWRDVGFECDSVVRAETELEVLVQVAARAEAVHNLGTLPGEMVNQVCRVVRDT
jgi:predicted small metal-binding protein